MKIFAGAAPAKDGTLKPTGTGRLCHWTHQGDKDADEFDSFGAYQRTLELRCDEGEPGVIQWTPDKNTPDTVYYQVFYLVFCDNYVIFVLAVFHTQIFGVEDQRSGFLR